jgi:aspartyl-tRNA(Asn)/glutamyl-tRNA(Gln) amidotransferase subunit A
MPRVPTVTEAAALMRSGRLDPVELTRRCLAQIDRLDAALKAWVVVDRDGALQAAANSAERLRAGTPLSRLDGVPIGVKDIIYTMGMRTRAGSPILVRLYAADSENPFTEPGAVEDGTVMLGVQDQDAPVVEKLRAAGAIILGKTATTEYACFDPAPTRNPWNPERTPGGSSCGSAVAVAAGMCCAALASQTGGSITRPAAFCGVCGLKPTYGRVSVRGVIPVAFSLDHVGAIARCVADLGVMLSVIAGYDPDEPLSENRPVPRGLSVIVPSVAVPRLVVAGGAFRSEAHPEAAAVVDRAVDRLRAAGAAVRAGGDVNLPRTVAMHRRIMAAELAEYHRPQYAEHRADYGTSIASLIEEGLALSAVDYAEARREQLERRRRDAAELGAGEFLLTPAAVGPAPGLETTGDPKFNSPFSYLGYPTVNIPCGLSADGLPIGLQLVGRPWEEDKLLEAAAWCERALGPGAAPPMVRD